MKAQLAVAAALLAGLSVSTAPGAGAAVDDTVVYTVTTDSNHNNIASLTYTNQPIGRDGDTKSVAKVVQANAAAMTRCWTDRKANPQMISQHGRQWQMAEPTEPTLNFPGYGAITPSGRQLAMNALDARRWAAARVMDDRRQDWY